MSKNVRFNISLNIDGKNVVVSASTSAQKLADNLNKAQTNGDRLRRSLLHWNQVQQSFQNINNGLQTLVGQMREYTSANDVQVQAETKLATVMRERMNATESDVRAIKDLAAAQQQLGVVGDEVQLMGAQQIATFANNRQTVETLIPAMNNLLVQQKGLNATGQDAANIGNLLGKALQGNVGALQRVGITFSEAQKKQLKFGNETERAAVLAQIITDNVGEMNAEMAKTDAGKAQQAANTFGDWKEKIGALIAPYQTLMVSVGQFGLALNAVISMTTGVTASVRVLAAWTNSVKFAAFNSRMASNAVAWFTSAIGLNTVSVRVGAAAVRGLTLAIRGLELALGIGAVIVAVSGIISLFASNTDKATDAMSDAQAEAQRFAEGQREVANAGIQARAALEQQTATLKGLIEQKKAGQDVSKEEKKIVGELNNTYGQTMGYFASVEGWYKALVANSEAYCRQMVIEAETRRLANQIAEKEEQRHSIVYDEKGNKKMYSTERKLKQRQRKNSGGSGNAMNALQNSGVNSIEYYYEDSAKDTAQKQYEGLTEDIGVLRHRLNSKVKEIAQITFKVKGTPTAPTTLGTGGSGPGKSTNKTGADTTKADMDKHLVADAKTYKDLTNNVAYYQQELERANISDEKTIATLLEKKRAAEEAVQAFNDIAEAEAVPKEMKTLEDYDKKLQFLQKQRSKANAENISGIDAEIKATEKARQAFEDMAIAAKDDSAINTYDELDAKLGYYNRLLQQGDAAQRRFASEGISRLKKLREEWEAIDEATVVNINPAQLNTLKELEAAISHLRGRQQGESGAQIGATQAEIDKLTKKQSALQLRIDMPSMEKQLADLQSLSGKEYRVKVQGIGFEGLRDKIKEIEELMRNPNLASDQLEQLRNLRDGYASMLGDSISTMGEMRKGWDGVRGIGNSIESITQSLKGNANAWQIVSGIIDGTLAIYDGFKAVVAIVQLLTTASQAHSAAKTVEAGATIAAGVAQTATAPAAEAAAAAEIPLVAANKAAAASYLELAAAAYMAAHAYIPFAGFGIGAGFAASAKALVASMAIPMAQGGIVSGPTLGLVGEYAGARNNPEVVAPLDKLRTYLEPRSPLEGSQVHFRIDGRDLVGVLKKETRYTNRIG